VEVVQNARVLKLEGANTKLRAELEQARLKVVEKSTKTPCAQVTRGKKVNVRFLVMPLKP
jgi:hypothetical protein